MAPPLKVTSLEICQILILMINSMIPLPKTSQWSTNGCYVQPLYYIFQFFGIFSVTSLVFEFYQKVYDKLGYVLSISPHFFLKLIYIGSLTLIEQFKKQFNLPLSFHIHNFNNNCLQLCMHIFIIPKILKLLSIYLILTCDWW